MAKPLFPAHLSLTDIKAQLASGISACTDQVIDPLSLSTKLACTFKLALLEGIYQHINSLDYESKIKFMRDFRYKQIEQSLVRLSNDTRREKVANEVA